MRRAPRKNRASALYVHVPFCAHICGYCDFVKLLYNERLAREYIDALFREMDSYHIGKVETIYLGGGTPTALSDALFERLLAKVSPYLIPGGEFTSEANVENLSEAKLALMKKYGVNRLSIGVESTDDGTLRFLGRHHTFEEAKDAVRRAKSFGFGSLSVDLIYGVPGQSEAMLRKDLDNILALDVDHVSIYSLSVLPGTIFYLRKVKEQGQDQSRRYYDIILKTMREHGYVRYEVSNFARNGKMARHNIVYWRDRHYYGVGLGASGYLGDVRYRNTPSLKRYLAGDFLRERETVTPKDDVIYYLMTNLRLEKGFSLAEFRRKFGYGFLRSHKEAVEALVRSSLLRRNDGRISLTDEGMMLMDLVLIKLI